MSSALSSRRITGPKDTQLPMWHTHTPPLLISKPNSSRNSQQFCHWSDIHVVAHIGYTNALPIYVYSNLYQYTRVKAA